jgi:hypothetical protein
VLRDDVLARYFGAGLHVLTTPEGERVVVSSRSAVKPSAVKPSADKPSAVKPSADKPSAVKPSAARPGKLTPPGPGR